MASVIPQKESVVYGVLWQVSLRDIESLDLYEGVRHDTYKKKHDLPIKTKVGEFSAFIYIAGNQYPGKPLYRYLDEIIYNAIVLQFDSHYIENLKQWISE